MLHRLLPTQERIARLGTAGEERGLCLHFRLEVEGLPQFFDCTRNMVPGLALLGCVQQLVPGLTPEAAVRLDFGTILSEEENLTALLILATGL